MLLVDHEIRKYCTVPAWMPEGKPMIDPFSESVKGGGIISYGLSSAGYDVRLDNKIMLFKPSYGEAIDPRKFDDPGYRGRMFDELICPDGQPVIIPVGGYVLGQTKEWIHIPRGVKARVVGKSTLARCGIVINCTPMEPGWRGRLTLEIMNGGPVPSMVFPGWGIAQFEFEVLSAEPQKDYTDLGGKYNDQKDVTPARVL